MGNDPYRLKSVEHALRVVRLVANRGSVTVGDVASELAVAPSTAHRLLSTLRHEAFVAQDRPGGVYHPGPTITELTVAAFGGVDLRDAARPVLDELRTEVQETVSLVVLVGKTGRFIESVEGPRSVRVVSRLGVVLPAHCTSGGKALLAALAPEDLESRFPDHQLDGVSPHSIRDWDALHAELNRIRRRGWATNFGEGDGGIAGLGACIRGESGAPVAGIAVAAPISRLRNLQTAFTLAPALLESAAAVEQRLGRADRAGAPDNEAGGSESTYRV